MEMPRHHPEPLPAFPMIPELMLSVAAEGHGLCCFPALSSQSLSQLQYKAWKPNSGHARHPGALPSSLQCMGGMGKWNSLWGCLMGFALPVQTQHLALLKHQKNALILLFLLLLSVSAALPGSGRTLASFLSQVPSQSSGPGVLW